MTKMIKN